MLVFSSLGFAGLGIARHKIYEWNIVKEAGKLPAY
jgi:hypothetical protein